MPLPRTRLERLRQMTTLAEVRGRKSCLLCGHLQLLHEPEGYGVRCDLHLIRGTFLRYLADDYWKLVESRAVFCHDFDCEVEL